MGSDYQEIGRRISQFRRKTGLTQAQVAERAEISDKYLSNIERAKSIPSIEVIMRLAAALDTTPDAFLVGTARLEDARWKNVAQRLRNMDEKHLDLAEKFLAWLSREEL